MRVRWLPSSTSSTTFAASVSRFAVFAVFAVFDDLVALVVGNPAVGQGSPAAFFVRTSSSVTSAITSSLRARRALRRSFSASSSCSLVVSARLNDDGGSLLWPQPLALTGMWNNAGDVSIVMRDRLSAGSWRHSPLSRELGRELVLTGKRTATGLSGTVIETITGLRATPVAIEGAFSLHHRGPLTGIVHAPDFTPKDATAPTWLAPPDLDAEACDDLGVDFGTATKLLKPSLACNKCMDGTCTADDMYSCGAALRAAGYNFAPVLAAVHGSGDVKPPTGAWTWDDCAAQVPEYNDERRACLDIAALHCAHALVRRGPAQKPGPVGDLFRSLAAVFAADEALAADLLATEAQIDTAFAFKDANASSCSPSRAVASHRNVRLHARSSR